MNEGMISKRYAKALLLYAIDRKAEDAMFAEMKKLASVYLHEPRLRMAMDSPILSSDDKLGLVKAAVGGKPNAEFVRFAELVVKNKRETYFRNIALCYIDLYCEAKQINMGKLITATPVDSAVVEKMKGLLHKIKPGTLDFETSVDPDIEGGFILYIDTYRMDASVRNQLKRIKQQFIVENSRIG
ncbi:MAG: F0F1 ATP synthase subunit delta [Prevotella sp.]|jgi:F-type H+-transporting ATPase subunit delta|nr:F0F1 ATP synthase subunit delta [Prevotella sp.]